MSDLIDNSEVGKIIATAGEANIRAFMTKFKICTDNNLVSSRRIADALQISLEDLGLKMGLMRIYMAEYLPAKAKELRDGEKLDIPEIAKRLDVSERYVRERLLKDE